MQKELEESKFVRLKYDFPLIIQNFSFLPSFNF